MDALAGTRDRPFDLLVVGEVNPDIVVSDPDPRPAFGQAERIVRDIRLAIGSSPVITACGAARLGLRVAMVGVVGDDEFGRFMLAAMAERGLDVSAVRVDRGLPTGASVILSDGRDRAILTARGSIGAVTLADLPEALLAQATHLHLGSWFLQDGLRPDAVETLARARAAGLTTSIDPNWDPAESWDAGLLDMLPLLDLAFPNAAEVTRIGGVDDVEAAAVALARRATAGAGAEAASRRVPLIVVKCGADGAIAASPDGVVARIGPYPVDPVDTTGAGDAFDAGFLSAWLGGAALPAAMRAGSVAGALTTTAVGGVDGQPDRLQLDAALRTWPS